ncbi:hypothetical protein PCI56_00335 [Plesiomonas shigelloides subsp. oncorhynchi]|nr:hypothetical protein [Plesiomonas shigelloides]
MPVCLPLRSGWVSSAMGVGSSNVIRLEDMLTEEAWLRFGKSRR